jgi:phosphate transport system substrate-binding protein
VIAREDGSGTRGAFKSLIMKKQRITPYALVQDSNGAVREMVANDINAIGFISVGLVNNNVKAIRVDDVPPTYENILSKKYRLIRPFLLVYKSKLNQEEQGFIDFIISEEGQSILKKEGLAPVSGDSSAP